MPLRSLLSTPVLAATIACAAFIPALRAEPLEPPLELLFDRANVLVAGTLADTSRAGHLVFRRDEVLHAGTPPPERIDVRAAPAAIANAKIGERYIVGYTAAMPDPRHPGAMVADPRGPVLLDSAGLEPALFVDSPELRRILRQARSERGRDSQEMRGLLFAALEGRDQPLQSLAAAQIALDPDLAERLTNADRARLEAFVRAPGNPASARTMLLAAAAADPAHDGDWAPAVAKSIVTTPPAGGYTAPAESVVGLVRLAFDIVDRRRVPVAAAALGNWIGSGSVSLADRALTSLQRQRPAAVRPAIDAALAQPGLPEQTRTFLERTRQRLERVDASRRKQAEGSR